MQILLLSFWGGAWNSAFLICSWVRPGLLVRNHILSSKSPKTTDVWPFGPVGHLSLGWDQSHHWQNQLLIQVLLHRVEPYCLWLHLQRQDVQVGCFISCSYFFEFHSCMTLWLLLSSVRASGLGQMVFILALTKRSATFFTPLTTWKVLWRFLSGGGTLRVRGKSVSSATSSELTLLGPLVEAKQTNPCIWLCFFLFQQSRNFSGELGVLWQTIEDLNVLEVILQAGDQQLFLGEGWLDWKGAELDWLAEFSPAGVV